MTIHVVPDLELVAAPLRNLAVNEHLLDQGNRSPHESPNAQLAAPRRRVLDDLIHRAWL